MNSFELDIISEKERAGSEFMFRLAQELQRAFLSEKKTRKITQQAIADQLETSRAVINRQLQGLENLGARRIGELLWALGWEMPLKAQRIPDGENQNPAPKLEVRVTPPVPSQGTAELASAKFSVEAAAQ